jgi:hypothetical protein
MHTVMREFMQQSHKEPRGEAKFRMDQAGKNANALRRAVEKLGSEEAARDYAVKFQALSRSVRDPEFNLADNMIKDLLRKDFSQNEIRQLLHVGCGRIIRVEKELKTGIKSGQERSMDPSQSSGVEKATKQKADKRQKTTTSSLEAQYHNLEVLNMKSVNSLHVMLRDKRSNHAQFKHYADRLMR